VQSFSSVQGPFFVKLLMLVDEMTVGEYGSLNIEAQVVCRRGWEKGLEPCRILALLHTRCTSPQVKTFA
jgi:hypothetical protein